MDAKSIAIWVGLALVAGLIGNLATDVVKRWWGAVDDFRRQAGEQAQSEADSVAQNFRFVVVLGFNVLLFMTFCLASGLLLLAFLIIGLTPAAQVREYGWFTVGPLAGLIGMTLISYWFYLRFMRMLRSIAKLPVTSAPSPD